MATTPSRVLNAGRPTAWLSPESVRGVRYRMRTVHLAPLLVGAIVAVFLIAVPQSREVYLATSMEHAFGHALLGFLLIALLCVQLDCWHRILGRSAIDRSYPEHTDLNTDRSLHRLNSRLCQFAALLPMLGLALGAGRAMRDGFSAGLILYGDELGKADLIKEFGEEGFASLITLASTVLFLGVALAIFGLWYILQLGVRAVVSWGDHNRRRTDAWLWATTYGLGALSAAAIFVPLLPWTEGYAVPFAQAIGPIAAVAIVTITLVTLLMGLSYLSSIMRVPVFGTVLLFLLGWLIWQIWASSSPAEVTPALAARAPADSARRSAQSDDVNAIAPYVRDWLAARDGWDGQAFGASRPYPIFIVASQGGGIYAAAASAAFLADMQDECPAFAQHIFAISGVSGGAVGASIFNALTSEAAGYVTPSTLPACATALSTPTGAAAADRKGLSKLAADIISRDHLSAALLQIWPDFVRKSVAQMTGVDYFGFDRSTALERSVACAFPAADASPWFCGPATDGKHLRALFSDHWSPGRVAPALVLSATWAETGYRTAFAPFPLYGISDGTNFSFPSGDNPGDFVTDKFETATPEPSLIEAAFVSARFPAIVPSYSVTFEHKAPGGESRLWNFVDGGYVDNSGATTALELHKAVTAVIDKEFKGQAKVYLIILTDVTTDPDLTRVGSGTTYSDTVAPASALLSVRAQLADRAVTRAIDEITKGEAPPPEGTTTGMANHHNIRAGITKADLAGRGKDISQVLVVNLKQRNYSFPLGWKISPITHDFVRRLLGRASECKQGFGNDRPPDDWERVTNDNSCIKASIRELLTGKTR